MDKNPTSSTPLAEKPAEPVLPIELDLTGMTLGDFKIRRRLGRGGMGQVYLAEQISLKREVALKALRSDLAVNSTSLERFDAEAKAVAKATHANIVQIYVIDRAVVKNQVVHYLALEYVDGRNLSELLEKKGTPDLLMGLSIMHQVGSALQRASELGIIHRDIKPENILITRQGEVKVADFGLSRCFTETGQPLNLTQTGVSMGTPLYMAPEQVELRPVDPRTDIYSFGVTCYHMWAGQPPFKGTSPFEIALQHVQKDPVPLHEIRPDLPIELCTLIHRMMAKKPEDRPQTSREIVREVSRLRDMLIGVTTGTNFAASESAELPLAPPIPVEAAAPPSGRLLRLLLPCIVVLSAVGVGLGGSFLYWNNVSRSQANVGDDDHGPAKSVLAFEEKEKELIAAKEKKSPPKEPGDVKYTLDLGIFYLQEGRLDKAENLFRDMSGQKEFGDAGKQGIAMVLALRGDTILSNQKFKESLPAGKKKDDKAAADKKKDDAKTADDMPTFWRHYPPWRRMIATALYHNKANIPTAFPGQQLDRWLLAPNPSRKAAAAQPKSNPQQ